VAAPHPIKSGVRSHPRRSPAGASRDVDRPSSGLLWRRWSAAIGPDGKPAKPGFTGNDFRHPAGEPFFCFDAVDESGGKGSACREIKEWCAKDLEKVRAAARPILSECKAVETVTCFQVKRQTRCFVTDGECKTVREAKWADSGYASDCKTIDKTFQPSP
jgi:hypothetical protein